MDSFCKFMTTYAGECGVWVPNSVTRCRLHQGKKETPVREKHPHNRGFSREAVEQGYFQNPKDHR